MSEKRSNLDTWKTSPDNDHITNHHLRMTKKEDFISNELQLQNQSIFSIRKYKSLFSATSLLSCLPMAYNTTASLDKLTCIDYMDFVKTQDRIGQCFWSKRDSNHLEVRRKIFKEDDNK